MWDLKIGENDPRVPENLGSRQTETGTPWLTPLSQSITRAEQLVSVQRLRKNAPVVTSVNIEHDPYFYDHNVLFVLFDQPIIISAIRYEAFNCSPFAFYFAHFSSADDIACFFYTYIVLFYSTCMMFLHAG
jgi:hypothetical protein